MPESPVTKKRKNLKPSPVKDFFDVVTEPKAGLACKECAKKNVSTILAAQGTTTSHLHNHLRVKHPEVYATVVDTAAPTAGVLEQWARGNNVTFDEKALTDLVTRFIVVAKVPFNIVSSIAFQELTHYLNGKANLLSRATVTRHNDTLFAELQPRVREAILAAIGRVSFTTDEWSSPNKLPFKCITCH